MTVKGWIWKAIFAGTSGSIVHFLFMYLKGTSNNNVFVA